MQLISRTVKCYVNLIIVPKVINKKLFMFGNQNTNCKRIHLWLYRLKMIFYIMCSVILAGLPLLAFFNIFTVFNVSFFTFLLFLIFGIFAWCITILAVIYENHRKKFMVFAGIFFCGTVFISFSPDLKHARQKDTCIDL